MSDDENLQQKNKPGFVRPVFAFLVPFLLLAIMAWVGETDDMERYYYDEMSRKGITPTHGWQASSKENIDITFWCAVSGCLGGLIGLGAERICTLIVRGVRNNKRAERKEN